MTEPLVSIETSDWKGKLCAGLLVVGALAFAWFAVKWQIGNMFASLTPPNDPHASEVAALAHSLSPRDPLANWLKGNVEKEIFSPENLDRSIESLQEMIRYAPEDYRYWIELGRGFEQAEKEESAARAFRRAVELAPNYSSPRWHLGNFHLRKGNETEAFDELRRSAELNPPASQQFFAIVWDYYEQDPARLEALAGDRPEVRAALAKFYAARERAEDSLRVWNTFSEQEKQAHGDVAKLIAQALYEKRFYRAAVEFVRQLDIEREAQAETVQNGGFETPIPEDPRSAYFNWKLTKLERVDARPDPVKKKEGGRSLRITFSGFAGVELKNVAQIVAIEPNRKYALNYWLKTENLKSAGTPTVEIVNAGDDKLIATSPGFATGTADWTPLRLEFVAPEGAEAVIVRLGRGYCGDACPITGTAWLDELRLEKLD